MEFLMRRCSLFEIRFSPVSVLIQEEIFLQSIK